MVKIRNSLHQAISEKAREHNACVIRRFTHGPPGNGKSDASIAFWLRKVQSASKPLPQLAIREYAKFFVQNWTKKLFLANKDPKTNFNAWMILQKPVLSFKCNDFFKMANLKAISFSATLIADWSVPYIRELTVVPEAFQGNLESIGQVPFW